LLSQNDENDIEPCVSQLQSAVVNVYFIVLMQQHDYRSEQPVTIWTEMRDRAHVSQYQLKLVHGKLYQTYTFYVHRTMYMTLF